MTETVNDAPDRADRFRADVAAMRLKTGRSDAELRLQILGVVLMIVGVAVAFGAYRAATNVTATPGTNVDVLNSNAYIPLAIAGLAISLSGGFVFLRYSLARFLRFWLLRQSYEQQAALDEAAGRTRL
ncbi:MAG TPA: hypothetical protein VH914_14435 [Acidimicrobiia bacterium]|jgi:hypothetical protein|nr:hypothetical protein [Acidimicrobiia bacterium]